MAVHTVLSEEPYREANLMPKRVKRRDGTIRERKVMQTGIRLPSEMSYPEEAEATRWRSTLGACGSHIGGKNLAFNVMRRGFLAHHEAGAMELNPQV
ncbi:hypothetical protein Nepgr_017681 [Nepenthes gracilis]|uniref:Uncharacterized protein n=1 Tax=Nepenthes gracilis TaxID=150966 RepID=A0AAD3XTL5_NEPGR|nr:hypothetical protein Nepgr_017681 [Nepenthes gracilis]